MLPRLMQRQSTRVLLAARLASRSLSSVATSTAATSSAPSIVASIDRSLETMEALKKMLLADQTRRTKTSRTMAPVSDESLNRALSYFKAQVDNARLCIKDTKEAGTVDYACEYKNALQAMQASVQAYVDFLELLAHCTLPNLEAKQAWEAKRTEIFEQLQMQLKEMKTCVRKA
ncbi:hypothetical protein MPSEU_000023400 [Mayamaea pseudoterrestris]|nr:hypothetical protein MPSEU_000023400 [Mayamaea pseudoterrestris]